MTPPDVWASRLLNASPDLREYIDALRRHNPNPGSDVAVDLGCICDRERNRDGEGVAYIWMSEGVVAFEIDDDCPLLERNDE